MQTLTSLAIIPIKASWNCAKKNTDTHMAMDNGATHSSFKLNVNSDTKTTGSTGDKGTYVENFPFIPFQLSEKSEK